MTSLFCVGTMPILRAETGSVGHEQNGSPKLDGQWSHGSWVVWFDELVSLSQCKFSDMKTCSLSNWKRKQQQRFVYYRQLSQYQPDDDDDDDDDDEDDDVDDGWIK